MILIDDKPVSHFWTVGEILNITPYGDGHINDTYLVNAENGRFILQRVNKTVFDTKALVHNYEIHVPLLIKYQNANKQKLSPTILKTKKKRYHHIDNENSAWRLVEFMPEVKSYNISPDPGISFEAARAIARYQLFLNTINAESLMDTITGFHDLSGRFELFKKVIKSADCQLLLKAKDEIKKVLGFQRIVENTKKYFHKTPFRITHNDTKLDNVIFTGNNALVIDLDTVMPGKLMFDFGDMIRSYTSPVAEDNPDIEKTELRSDHFIAVVKGYLGELKQDLNQDEKASLFQGAKYIIYEQSIRFLTDFLQGNIYYKIDYDDHNLVRAQTQLKLLQSLDEQEGELTKEMKYFL